MTKAFNWNEAQWFSHWYVCLKLNTGQKQHRLWGQWSSVADNWHKGVENKDIGNLTKSHRIGKYGSEHWVKPLLQESCPETFTGLEQIIGFLWNFTMTMPPQKNLKSINEALQQAKLSKMQNLFLRSYSK